MLLLSNKMFEFVYNCYAISSNIVLSIIRISKKLLYLVFNQSIIIIIINWIIYLAGMSISLGIIIYVMILIMVLFYSFIRDIFSSNNMNDNLNDIRNRNQKDDFKIENNFSFVDEVLDFKD